MFNPPLLTRAAITTSLLRWAIVLVSLAAGAAAFVAFAAGRSLGFLAVFALDTAVAALATVANERTLDAPDCNQGPSPEEMAVYILLHCGVLAGMLMSCPRGLMGFALLVLHQSLLVINARRLPSA